MVALLSQASARSRSSSDSQTCFSGPLSYAFCCSWLEWEARCAVFSSNYFHACLLLCNCRFYYNGMRPIAISWQCLAVAVPPEQLQSKDKHFPISTQHLFRCCETKTSTFPSLHSTCFAVAKQRQALFCLYTALAEQLSRISHLDKNFPI